MGLEHQVHPSLVANHIFESSGRVDRVNASTGRYDSLATITEATRNR
jgi:hypothetical protein